MTGNIPHFLICTVHRIIVHNRATGSKGRECWPSLPPKLWGSSSGRKGTGTPGACGAGVVIAITSLPLNPQSGIGQVQWCMSQWWGIDWCSKPFIALCAFGTLVNYITTVILTTYLWIMRKQSLQLSKSLACLENKQNKRGSSGCSFHYSYITLNYVLAMHGSKMY